MKFLINKKNLKFFSYSLLSIIAIFLNIQIFQDLNQFTKKNLVNINFHLWINIIIIIIVGIIIYNIYQYFYNKNYNGHWLYKGLAWLFSFFMIIGNSYKQIASWNLVFGNLMLFMGSIVILIGYYLLFKSLILILVNYLNNLKLKYRTNIVFNFLFVKHPFISNLVIILICWLPYIVAFYPGILSPDPSNQIKQYFNIDTHYIEGVVLIDEDVKITNHHPVLHTLLLGGSVHIGQMIGNDNFGIFIFSFFQIIILSVTLAFTIFYMKKLKMPHWFMFTSLLIYSLVPVFPLYSMSVVKDTIFTALVIIYIIIIFDFVKYHKNKISFKKMALIIGLILLIMLFRNNGIYMIILSFPLLFLIRKDIIWKLIIILFTPLIIFQTYEKVILPYYKITPGSIREVLSIPFQQTARLVQEKGHELSSEEIKKIDHVLTYKTLAERYNPELADSVKNRYNKYTNDEELKDYFKVWFNGFLRYPGIYVQATLNNTYGYFYPGSKKWYVYYKYDERLKESGFNYHYNQLTGLRNVLSSYGVAYPSIPIIGLMVNIAFHVWGVLFLSIYLFVNRQYKYLIYLLPTLSLILVCFASPANTYFRYAMPYVFSSIIVIAMFVSIIKKRS